MSDEETYSTVGAVCPYCGTVHPPGDGDYDLYDEATSEWECARCDGVFVVSVYVSHSWQTKAKETPDE